MSDILEICERLADFFDATEVKWKPQTISGNRALAIAYVDARVIMDRLDDVLGVGGWQDEYEFLPDGSCLCRLRLRIGYDWVQKMDVGGESEQKDEGDRRKAALSDALKRAAVKFGLGRYLYRLPAQWVDYDPQKKQFVKAPTLPSAVIPAAKKPQKSQAKPGEMDGAELEAILTAWGKGAVKANLTDDPEYIRRVALLKGQQAGYPAEMNNWGPEMIKEGLKWGKEAGADLRKQKETART